MNTQPQINYFALAVTLARTEAAMTLARTKRTQDTCRCAAYPFPHRQGSKECAELSEEPDYCYHCNGSGEGSHDGSRCYHCKGSGVIKTKHDWSEA